MPDHTWNLSNRTVEMDPDLEQIASNEGLSFDDKVRSACMLLEVRIRQVAGLKAHDFGSDLIKQVFGDKGRFTVSPVPAENIGLMNLFLGTVLYYRNPVSHRSIHHDADETLHVLLLVNHLLFLLRKASSVDVDISEYLGYHEGFPSQRRDFRVDLDGDGEAELVALLTTSGQIVNSRPQSYLHPVILKKSGGNYRRIPCEVAWDGDSMYGPLHLMTHHITGQPHPDIVAVWSLGETMSGFFIFRYDGMGYVRVERDIVGNPEPYADAWQAGFTQHGAYKHTQFVDYDGDGQVEIVQRLNFVFDHDWKDLTDKRDQTRARVWKWDANSGLLKCVLDVEMDQSVMHQP